MVPEGFVTITVGKCDMRDTASGTAETSHLQPQAGSRASTLGLAQHFEDSKLTLSDTCKPHLLTLPHTVPPTRDQAVKDLSL